MQGLGAETIDISLAVREVCLWLPESEEFISHGAPNFRVRGKTFATYAVNHHGDGHVALWLNAAPGVQDLLVKREPEHYYVPPYVGPRGWLGVKLDRGIAWSEVAKLVRAAYERCAPAALTAMLGTTPPFKIQPRNLTAAEVDPFKSPRAAAAIAKLRKICLALPETRETQQFGHPQWRVGRKGFVLARFEAARLAFCFWVGVDQQGLYLEDPRFTLPPFMGHAGWIALDVSGSCDWQEVSDLSLGSYRHFALKRMLRDLEASQGQRRARR